MHFTDRLPSRTELLHNFLGIVQWVRTDDIFGYAIKPQSFISYPRELVAISDDIERCFNLLP